jgi:hypothetical protein
VIGQVSVFCDEEFFEALDDAGAGAIAVRSRKRRSPLIGQEAGGGVNGGPGLLGLPAADFLVLVSGVVVRGGVRGFFLRGSRVNQTQEFQLFSVTEAIFYLSR